MQTYGGSSSSQSRRPASSGQNGDESHVVWGAVGTPTQTDSSGSSGNQPSIRDLDGILLRGEEESSSLSGNNTDSGNDGMLGGEDIPEERDLIENSDSFLDFESLRRLPKKELVNVLPVDHLGNITSIGSLRHELGICKPCTLSRRKKGCKQGMFCLFCHFEHDPADIRKRARPCKAQRVRYRKCLQRLANRLHGNGEELDPAERDDEALSKERRLNMANETNMNVYQLRRAEEHQMEAPPPKCPHGHTLAKNRSSSDANSCDICGTEIMIGAAILSCKRCNYHLCQDCRRPRAIQQDSFQAFEVQKFSL